MKTKLLFFSLALFIIWKSLSVFVAPETTPAPNINTSQVSSISNWVQFDMISSECVLSPVQFQHFL